MAELDVAYVLLRFPSLTETFIAEEIRHLLADGIRLRLYSLLPGRDQVIHPASRGLLPQTHYVPGLRSGSLWRAQAYYLLRAPSKYLGLLAMILRQPMPHPADLAKRLDIFLKGVWVAKELEQTSVELIHAHFAWLPAIAGLVVGRLLGIPFTFTAHAYDIYSKRNDLLPLASRAADKIITISEANKLTILSMNPGLAPAKVEVLHCGIDLVSFQPSPANLATKRLQITSVGSLLPKKGHEYLIRACRELQSQQVDFECIIVGCGGLEESLNRLIRELGLGDTVTLAGAQPQEWLRDRLGRSDIFVLACVADPGGDRDGIPVAIMEAMAMGVPVISTPVSGIPELVRNEETGLLVSQRNVRELAAAIRRLADDEDMRRKIVKNGLDLVSREYDVVKNTGRLAKFFEESIRVRHQTVGSPA